MQNPYKDFSSVNPQREDGHREIETSVFQALIRAGLSGLEYALVLFIIDKTWGWNKKEDQIPLSQFVDATGFDKRNVGHYLKRLQDRHIILILRSGPGRGRVNTYMFNKYWDTWITDHIPGKDVSTTPLPEKVSPTHHLPLNSVLPTPFTEAPDKVGEKVSLTHQSSPNGVPATPLANGVPATPLAAGKGVDSAGKGVGHAQGKGVPATPSIENNRNINRKKDIKNTPSSEAIELAHLLKGLILRNNPKAKTPDDITKWAIDLDRMLKIDHRTPEEIKFIIEFSQNDSFWCANILSGAKLRDKFDQLYLRAKEKGGPDDAGRKQRRGPGARREDTGKGDRFSGFRAIESRPGQPDNRDED